MECEQWDWDGGSVGRQVCQGTIGPWPTGAVLSARLNLAETGSTNPTVEIWGRQDGPALAALPPWTRTWAFLPMGPPVPSCVILSHSMMATRHEYVARQTHHHVPRLIMAGASPFSFTACTALSATALNRCDRFLSVCICTCVCGLYICDWKKKLITKLKLIYTHSFNFSEPT